MDDKRYTDFEFFAALAKLNNEQRLRVYLVMLLMNALDGDGVAALELQDIIAARLRALAA